MSDFNNFLYDVMCNGKLDRIRSFSDQEIGISSILEKYIWNVLKNCDVDKPGIYDVCIAMKRISKIDCQVLSYIMGIVNESDANQLLGWTDNHIQKWRESIGKQ